LFRRYSITASGVWAQQSASPASDQKVNRSWEATAQLLKLECSAPPAFDQKSGAVFEQQAANVDAAAQCGLGTMYYGLVAHIRHPLANVGGAQQRQNSRAGSCFCLSIRQ
jgi:hypothetical protein